MSSGLLRSGCALGTHVAVVLAILSLGPVPAAEAAGEDYVTGSGTAVVPGHRFTITLDVRSGPSGEAPHGTYHQDTDFGSGTTTAIACLNVSGNRAVVGIDASPPYVGVVYSGFLAGGSPGIWVDGIEVCGPPVADFPAGAPCPAFPATPPH